MRQSAPRLTATPLARLRSRPLPATLRTGEIAIETDVCQICAACCKNVPFVELSAAEIGVLEAATGLHPDLFTDRKRTEPEEHFLSFDENGDCVFLAATPGAHACSVYAARPAICREYPWTHKQTAACAAHSERCLAAGR